MSKNAILFVRGVIVAILSLVAAFVMVISTMPPNVFVVIPVFGLAAGIALIAKATSREIKMMKGDSDAEL